MTKNRVYMGISPAKGVWKENNKDIIRGLDLNPGCMSSGKLCSFWGPLFPHLWNGDDDTNQLKLSCAAITNSSQNLVTYNNKCLFPAHITCPLQVNFSSCPWDQTKETALIWNIAGFRAAGKEWLMVDPYRLVLKNDMALAGLLSCLGIVPYTKRCKFDSHSGHISRLWVRSPMGVHTGDN